MADTDPRYHRECDVDDCVRGMGARCPHAAPAKLSEKELLFAQRYGTPVDWKIPGSVTGRFNASSPPETFTLRTLDKIAQWMWPEQPLPSEERVCRTLRGCLEEGGCTTPISCTETWNRCKPLWFIKEKP